MINSIQHSLDSAKINEGKLLNTDILTVSGMSGIKGRLFLNNLCEHIANLTPVKYLEIGSWQGSTILAASYKNVGEFYAVDDFSQFSEISISKCSPEYTLIDSVENVFMRNKERFKKDCQFSFIGGDCWKIDQNVLPKNLNIYFYDGPHGLQDHEDALTKYLPVLADEFIFIVDDWNGYNAKQGTKNGIEKNNLKQLYYEGVGDNIDSDPAGWWNGFGIYYLKK